MKLNPFIIIIAVALLVFLWATCERKAENNTTDKENATIEANEAEIEQKNDCIECSRKLDSAYAAGREYEAALWAIKEKEYEEKLQQRANRVRVPVTAPTSERVAELRKLSTYFKTEEWERAVNNRSQQ